MIQRLFLLFLLYPLTAFAAGDAESEDLWFGIIAAGAFILYGIIKQPELFRKSVQKSVVKHEKYVPWIREQNQCSETLSDDEVWGIIEDAVTLRTRVQLALCIPLMVIIYKIYPLYAEPIIGPSPAYWKEVLLGISGGLIFAAVIRFCGRLVLRLRIKRLVDVS